VIETFFVREVAK